MVASGAQTDRPTTTTLDRRNDTGPQPHHAMTETQIRMIESRRMGPGPDKYFDASSIYKQPTRHGNFLGTRPAYTFGRSERPQSYMDDIVKASSSPGPVYQLKGKVGAASGATAVGTSVGTRFGTEMRTGYPVHGTPGPGSYSPRSTFKGGVVSNGINKAGDAPSSSFGRAYKPRRPEAQLKKAEFLGKEFARENIGVHSPGPGAYLVDKNVTSNNGAGFIGDAPAFSMRPNTTFDRSTAAQGTDRGITTDTNRRLRENTPGPGSYSNLLKPMAKMGGPLFGKSDIQIRPEEVFARVPFMGNQYSRENGGVHSPGPALYTQKGLTGYRQPDMGHAYKKQPAFSFGSAKRVMFQ